MREVLFLRRAAGKSAALLFAIFGQVSACAPEGRGTSGPFAPTGMGDSGGAHSSADGDPATEAGRGPGGDESNGPGPTTMDEIKFDTPSGGSGSLEGGHSGEGCEKVDFLFVIDNSSSMGDNQQNLVTSFPGFIDAIRSTLDAHDYHIMVVDSDEDGVLSQCNGNTCGTSWPRPACCPPLSGCNFTMGSGRNISANGSPCGFSGGGQYLTDADIDVESTFQCAARVGTSGNQNEMPMTAMLRSVSAELNSAGECNDGFIRDDAILVVTVVSDANSVTANIEHATGNAATWREALVAAKGGNADAIVVVGLFGDQDLPGGLCNGDQAGPEYRAWVESFGSRGFQGSVCLADYSQVFSQAVATIDATCDEFVPEG